MVMLSINGVMSSNSYLKNSKEALSLKKSCTFVEVKNWNKYYFSNLNYQTVQPVKKSNHFIWPNIALRTNKNVLGLLLSFSVFLYFKEISFVMANQIGKSCMRASLWVNPTNPYV